MGVFGGPNVSEDGLVLALDGANFKSFKGEATTNLISNPTEEMPRGEFGQYRDLASIFDTNGLTAYSLSMDIKTNIPGNVYVYMQNGSYTKYGFVSSNAYCTTEYQRFYFNNLTPVLSSTWQQNTPNDNRAVLATYTGYGSGINPTVKDIQLEQRSYSTKFVSGTRGATVAAGGGWADLTGNGNNGELVNGVRESSANGGSLSFDGSNDYVDLNTNNIITGTNPFTFEAFYKVTNASVNAELFGNYGSGYTSNTIWISGRYGVYINTVVPYFQGHPLGAGTYHMAFTRTSAGACTLYKNGAVDGTSTSTTSITAGQNFRIGSDVNGIAEVFGGELYSLKVYNRALSAAEVSQNFNALRGRFGI